MSMPEVALTLQPFKLAEGGGGILIETVGDGLSLPRLADQDGMTPEHHSHVLDLVPVDPSKDFGPTWVSCAVSDSVQVAASQDRSAAGKRGWSGRSAHSPDSWAYSYLHLPLEQTCSSSMVTWCRSWSE
uniref:Uncharacterized protein n=1 Tax=Nothobranchius furzeri TaxID=105023 RepID=A0A8C6L5F4_NOTFU